MITPNKFIRYEESTLSKLPIILDHIGEGVLVVDLFLALKRQFEDVSEFIYAIDALYVLDRVEIDSTTGVLKHADRNS